MRFLNMAILLLVFSIGFASHLHAQSKAPDIGYFINDRMEDGLGRCKFIGLKTYDSEGPVVRKGGESTCDVEKWKQLDFIVRCGSYSFFESTQYDIYKPGATVIIIVFTKPEMLLNELEIKYPVPFDDNYQKRSLFREARDKLRNYWLSIPMEARKQVNRAYAIAASPSGGSVLQWHMRVE